MQQSPTVQLSESAVARISKLLADEPPGTLLRIAVQGGGCSGFQYQYLFETAAPAESDLVLRERGAVVAIDDVSLGMMNGTLIDYAETLGSAGFEIKNPNAVSGCGCGNSFSV